MATAATVAAEKEGTPMKRLLVILLAVLLALAVAAPVTARGANLEPTIVTSNADGSTTFSTTATSTKPYTRLFVQGTLNGPNGPTEVIWVYNVTPTADGTSITISADEYFWWGCPCVAWFAETNNIGDGGTRHWHPYSADSESFTP
jgi:hypothetical protein